MKIRTGFVSNSSSSSFICTTCLSLNEINEKLSIIIDFYNTLFNTSLTVGGVFADAKHGSKEDWEILKEYIDDDDYWNDPLKESEIMNNIIIYSADDNTVPYSLVPIINECFDAINIHMG